MCGQAWVGLGSRSGDQASELTTRIMEFWCTEKIFPCQAEGVAAGALGSCVRRIRRNK